MGRRTGVLALVEWSLAFALLVLVVVSAVGVFLIPVALAVFVAVGTRHRVWPYLPLGVLTGVGALVAVIGLMHVADTRCVRVGTVAGSGSGSAGVRVVSRGGCSGLDGRQWLVVGGILALVGAAGYIALSQKNSVSRPS